MDQQIQRIYEKYLKFKVSHTGALAEICEELHSIEEILTFLLIKNPYAIGHLSKKIISAISKDC
jgi:hypothetical protein